MSKEYYGLVSGLQPLVVGKTQDFDLLMGKNNLSVLLEPTDLFQFLLLFYPFDNQNLIHFHTPDNHYLPYANIPSLELQDSLKNGYSDDLYLESYLNQYGYEPGETSAFDLEKNLTQHYYTFIQLYGIDFLKEWVKFEITLKNLSAIYTQRILKLSKVSLLEGGFFESSEMTRINPSDLDKEFPFLKKSFESLEISNPIERKKRVDEIKWDYLDQLTFFNFFGIEKVLAYGIKMKDLQEWKQLDPLVGKELFERFLSEIDNELESKLT